MHAGQTVAMHIDFNSFKAAYVAGDPASSCQHETSVRRLSTCSYAEDYELVSAGGGRTDKFVTQWRWFWRSGGSWQQFGEVSCSAFSLSYCSFAELSQIKHTNCTCLTY